MMNGQSGPHRALLAAGFVAISLAFAGAAAAQTQPTAIRAFDIATIEKLGFAMAEEAQQASVADDILSAQQHHPDQDGIVGWIFDPSPSTTRVRYIRERDGELQAAYDIVFTKSAPPKFSVPARTQLDARELAQFRARKLAAANIEKPCSPIYNTLALKDPESDRWLVWTLATASEPGTVAIGGHVRFTISADGRTLISRDPLSLSCIVAAQPQAAPGTRTGPSLVTHLMSDTPVETHVFVSLVYNMPLLVDVPDHGDWKVEQGRISKLPPMPVRKSGQAAQTRD
jgi:hypothetical protein